MVLKSANSVANADIKVLVVDDDHLVRSLIVQALARRPQLRLDEAGSKAEALALIQSESYDLVLSDIQMEAASAGVELLHAIKEHSPSTAVILLTAYGTLQTAIGALRERADNYLLKPVSMAELDTVVARALNRRATALGQQATLKRVLDTLQNVLYDKSAPVVEDTQPQAGDAPRYLSAGPIRLDTFQHRASVNGRPLELTATEWTILHMLLAAQRQVVTFEQLVEQTHQVQATRDEARELITSHIRNLRRKLGSSARRLMNVRGIGFCLVGEDV